MKRQQLVISLLLALLTGNSLWAQDTQKEKVSLIPKITAMANVRYSYDDQPKVDHGFDVRRVRLGLKGNLHEKLDYCIQAEYETSVKVLDAYLRWKIRPEINFQVGEFKVQHSQETLYGPTSWLVIENPAAVARLNGYNDLSGIKANGRDIGLMFYGSTIQKEGFDVFNYSLAVFNGSGINMKDENKQKDVATFLRIKPLKQISVTGGYYAGSYGARHQEHTRNRASAGVEWKDSRLTLRSEYLWGKTSATHSNGVYAQAAYKVHKMVQPVLSYDYFEPDKDGDAYQHNVQVGVNITPIKNLYIQAAYTHSFQNDDQHRNLAEVQAIVTY